MEENKTKLFRSESLPTFEKEEKIIKPRRLEGGFKRLTTRKDILLYVIFPKILIIKLKNIENMKIRLQILNTTILIQLNG